MGEWRVAPFLHADFDSSDQALDLFLRSIFLPIMAWWHHHDVPWPICYSASLAPTNPLPHPFPSSFSHPNPMLPREEGSVQYSELKWC